MKVMQRSMRNWRLALVALPLFTVMCGLILATTAARAATVFNVTFPISFPATNPCNGEMITFSGNEHDAFHLTFDGSGGVHIVFHANFQDVTGVGSFGNKYQLPADANDSFNAKVAQEENVTLSELVVSQGSAPNFVVKFDFHTTINPDGTVTSYFNNFTTACRG